MPPGGCDVILSLGTDGTVSGSHLVAPTYVCSPGHTHRAIWRGHPLLKKHGLGAYLTYRRKRLTAAAQA